MWKGSCCSNSRVTELGCVWGATQNMCLLSVATGAFCHALCPGSSTTAPIGVNMAFDDPPTPPGHTACHTAKEGGASFLTDSYCEKREWGDLGALVQVKHHVCKDVFLGHWLWSLRRYKVCLKLFARCPIKTHLRVDCLGSFTEGPSQTSREMHSCMSKLFQCHFCQTEWVKIQHSVGE